MKEYLVANKSQLMEDLKGIFLLMGFTATLAVGALSVCVVHHQQSAHLHHGLEEIEEIDEKVKNLEFSLPPATD